MVKHPRYCRERRIRDALTNSSEYPAHLLRPKGARLPREVFQTYLLPMSNI
jgi:hypothetical protein